MNLSIAILAFTIALAVLIVVHEYGHYAVARFFGVKVLRFSIGFGKPIWKIEIGSDRTEWVIAMFPLGGYVKMLDENEAPVAPGELHRAFNRQGVWRRIAIVCAGPLANFLLAIVIYWGLLINGVQESKPVIAAPAAGTLAETSGFVRGDTVLGVNGEPVRTWQEVRWRLLQLAVERQVARLDVLAADQQSRQRELDLENFDIENLEGDPLARMGLRLYRPDIAPVIGDVLPGGVAELQGLRSGDRIVAIDGAPIRTWDELVASVRAHPEVSIRLSIERDVTRFEISIEPQAVEQNGMRIGRIGAGPRVDPEALKALSTVVHYDVVPALGMALSRTWEMSIFSLRMLGKMVTGAVSWKNLSGPVTIADYAGQSAQLGLSAYVAFIALISISLGVLNFLPIPLLDGGHLMYYLVEIAKGSPVSERVMELGQRVGLGLLLFLMVFAFYNDINRLLAG